MGAVFIAINSRLHWYKNNVKINKDDMFKIVFGLKYNKKHEYP